MTNPTAVFRIMVRSPITDADAWVETGGALIEAAAPKLSCSRGRRRRGDNPATRRVDDRRWASAPTQCMRYWVLQPGLPIPEQFEAIEGERRASARRGDCPNADEHASDAWVGGGANDEQSSPAGRWSTRRPVSKPGPALLDREEEATGNAAEGDELPNRRRQRVGAMVDADVPEARRRP